MNTKIIYSLRVYTQLVIQGFQPIATMPNPQHPEFNCWIFENTEELEEAFGSILRGQNHVSI